MCMEKFLWCFLMVSMLAFSPTSVGATQTSPNINSAAQTDVVTGTVVDGSNEPLIGVSVRVVGSSEGTVTDLNGNFTINMKGQKALRFEYIGFTKQTVQIKNNKKLRVVMHEDLQQIDEVVVVGYGVQQKSHLTGSIAKVNTEDVTDFTTSRLDEALQGKAAGLQILNITSEIGEAPDIVIRGTSSFSANSNPLIVVDGFPYDDGLESLNPGDIKSVEILKDAAASAIYGSRAANGVILVTTKSGEANKPQYSFKSKLGTRSIYEYYNMLDTPGYINRLLSEYELTGQTLGSGDVAKYILSQHRNTDWQKEAIQDNPYYLNLDLSVSGGTNKVKYYISGAYNQDMGILKKNYFRRFNARARIDADLSSKVKVGINFAPSYTKSEKPGSGYMMYLRTPSWLPARHDEYTAALTGREVGEYTKGGHFQNVTYTGINPQTGEEVTITASPWNSSNSNPIHTLNETFQPQDQYRIQLQGYIEIKLLKNLLFRSANSYSFSYQESTLYRNEGARNDTDPSRAYYTNNKSVRLSSENTLTYDYKYKDIWDMNVLLGASVYQNTTTRAGILGFDFATDLIHTLGAAGHIDQYEGSAIRTGTWKSDDAMVSFYGRINASVLDRYLLSINLRTDGSSKFGKDKRWGWFPSVSAGWRISEEPWVKNNLTWLNQLKYRISYGLTGTNTISNYANTDLLDSTPYPLGTGNGSIVNGFANNSSTLGNQALQWEQTGEFNTGFDIAVLNSRIGLSVDFFYSKTKSLLYEKTVNSVSGYTKAWTNEGKLRNRGMELEINTVNIKNKKFRWNTSLNLSVVRNRLLDLGGPAEQITRGSFNEYYIARVGDPLIQFYGFKTIGVWQNQEEVDSNPHYITDRPGGLRVEDTDGNGVIDDNDRVPLGSPYPDFTWGMTNSFKYKQFDLSFLLQGQVGGKVLNATGSYNEMMMYCPEYIDGRWLSPEHPGDGKTPYYNFGISRVLTDYWIEDASYVSLRNITLGYSLPRKALRRLGLKSVRIYASGQNLLYVWANSYRGVNPEARNGSRSALTKNAAQRGPFPLMRTYNLGLNINF